MYRQLEKHLLNSNTSSTCPDNMVNFGLLTADICWRVLGISCKFQRVSRLGSVTARRSSSGRHPNFEALNRGRHLYSEGRPSRWALAHISSLYFPSIRFSSVTWLRDRMVYGLYINLSHLPRRFTFGTTEKTRKMWHESTVVP